MHGNGIALKDYIKVFDQALDRGKFHYILQPRAFMLVGIGGGVPSTESDIRLGDVMISQPRMQHGGMVQYDFRKTRQSGFTRSGLTQASGDQATQPYRTFHEELMFIGDGRFWPALATLTST